MAQNMNMLLDTVPRFAICSPCRSTSSGEIRCDGLSWPPPPSPPPSSGSPARRAAQPEPKPADIASAPTNSANDTISFEQYRDWRNHFIEERQTQLAARLAATNLSAAQRSRLEQQKAYYDWFAGLPTEDRDRRFRERFDQIDANRDGIIDAGERAAWHEKQRTFYDRGRNRQQAAARQTE